MSVTIDTGFDAGNIEVLSGADPSEGGDRWDLAIRADAGSDFYQWFHFRVAGARGRPLELRIVNAGGAAYPGGWPGYRARVSDDRREWRLADTAYDDGVLTIRHRPAGDLCWFAYHAPYPTERHHDLVATMAARPGVTAVALGRTLDGRPLDLLRLGEGPVQVWLYARQHPGETMCEWWMEGALEWLTGDDPAARALRTAATIHLVPNMCPDGSARGHLRTNAAGVNLNREWHAPSLERSPEVFLVRAEMDRTGVDVAIDVHGDEAIPHAFMAGFEGIPNNTERQARLYRGYVDALAAATPLFQTAHGYPVTGEGKANLSMSTNQLAHRYGAVSMTLEMPFKDAADHPDAERGWHPGRSKALAHACLAVLAAQIDGFRR